MIAHLDFHLELLGAARPGAGSCGVGLRWGSLFNSRTQSGMKHGGPPVTDLSPIFLVRGREMLPSSLVNLIEVIPLS